MHNAIVVTIAKIKNNDMYYKTIIAFVISVNNVFSFADISDTAVTISSFIVCYN